MKLSLLHGLVAAAAMFSSQQDKPAVPIPDLPKFDTEDAAAYGLALAKYTDSFDSGWVDEVMQGRMTLFDVGGDSVERRFSRMVLERHKDGDKLIIRFLAPAEIKGVSALTFENPGSSDDNWLYLPSTKRVRRISGANNTSSFQGTEFTYEDLSSLDPSEYEWRFVKETELERGDEKTAVYQLSARPTYKDTGYSRLTVYVNKKTWAQERIEYYDKPGKLLKTRESSEWTQYHDRFWRSHHIEMTNHQTGKRTLLTTEKEFLDLSRYMSKKTGKPRKNLPESLFTTQSLQK